MLKIQIYQNNQNYYFKSVNAIIDYINNGNKSSENKLKKISIKLINRIRKNKDSLLCICLGYIYYLLNNIKYATKYFEEGKKYSEKLPPEILLIRNQILKPSTNIIYFNDLKKEKEILNHEENNEDSLSLIFNSNDFTKNFKKIDKPIKIKFKW